MNIALDIGGTKTRVGLVSETYKLLETAFFLTDKDYDKGVKQIIDFIRAKGIKIGTICVGIAGVLNTDKEKLYSSPNLKGWLGKPLKKTIEKEFAAKVVLENDAALAGLGEAVYGSGRGYKIVSYFTIGTGVGGARIVNRQIDERIYGFEPGHQFLCSGCDGLCCNFKSGTGDVTFEQIVSGKSIKRRFGKSPEAIIDTETWEKIIKDTALGIANSIYFWSPEIIVLGGGVVLSDFFDISILKKEVRKIIKTTYPKSPEYKKSALGDFSGIWGGIAYLANNT